MKGEINAAMGLVKPFQENVMEKFSRLIADNGWRGGKGRVETGAVIEIVKSKSEVEKLTSKLENFV